MPQPARMIKAQTHSTIIRLSALFVEMSLLCACSYIIYGNTPIVVCLSTLFYG